MSGTQITEVITAIEETAKGSKFLNGYINNTKCNNWIG